MRKCLCALALLLLVGLCGCGGNRPTGESEILADLQTYVREHSSTLENSDQGSVRECGVERFEIVNRKTSTQDGTDQVCVNATITDLYDTMKTESQFVMDYKLYDDGWQLENINETECHAIPLAEPEGFEDEIADSIRYKFKYFNMSDFTVYDKSVDMEHGHATWSVTARNDRGYLTEALDAVAYISFDSYGYEEGYWYFDGNPLVRDEARTWDLGAGYQSSSSLWKVTSDERMVCGERQLQLVDLKDYSESRLSDEFFGGWDNLEYTSGMDFSTIRYAFVEDLDIKGNEWRGITILLFGANENDIYSTSSNSVMGTPKTGFLLRAYPVSVTR